MNLNSHSVKAITLLYNIHPITVEHPRRVLYLKDEINELLKIIHEKYILNREKYFTFREFIAIGGKPHDRNFLDTHTPSIEERINEFKNQTFLFPKETSLKIINSRKLISKSYSTKEVLELFGNIYRHDLNEILQNAKITPYEIIDVSSKYWDKKKIDDLLKKREDLYKYFVEHYYTRKEIKEITGLTVESVFNVYSQLGIVVNTINVPKIVQFDKYKRISNIYNVPELRNFQQLYNSFKKGKPSPIIKINNNINKRLMDVDTFIQSNPFLKKEKIKNIYNEILYYNVLDIDNFETKKVILYDNVRKIFNISIKLLDYIIDKYSLQIIKYGSFKFLETDKVKNVFSTLIEQQRNLLRDFYTKNQLPLIVNSNKVFYNGTIKKIKITNEELKFGILHMTHTLYSKKDTDKYISTQHTKNVMIDAHKRLHSSILRDQIFDETLLKLEIKFNEQQKELEKYWLRFAKKKLLKSKGKKKKIESLFSILIWTTKYLLDRLENEDLFELSSNSLNLKFFNLNQTKSYQLYLYSFLIYIKSLDIKSNFLIEKITNPHKYPKNSLDTSRYSNEEFFELLKYAKDIKLHKKNAIENFTKQISYKRYTYYESFWAYVIIHLNNGWRSENVISSIPRIPLPEGIKDINDFKNRDISMSEAQSIIYYLKGELWDTRHSKNTKSKYFFCSEELVLPLANALILCELVARNRSPNAATIICFGEINQISVNVQKKFFKEFPINNFTFKSLKANRTFITISNIVLKKLTNRNPLEITKFIRNHGSIETTNGYVVIDQPHLDKLCRLLFNKGQFGYFYDMLSAIVIGSSDISRIALDDPYLLIKNTFGDIYQIENLATNLNNFKTKNINEMKLYLQNKTIEEKKELINLIHLEQLPAKEEGYQCILGDCLYLNRSCQNCPFSIANLYCLNSIIVSLNDFLNEFENLKKEGIPGEIKMRCTIFLKNLELLSLAKKKFGEPVLTAFLGYDYSLFLKKINSLENIYQYIRLE